jgi:hypothetical protein
MVALFPSAGQEDCSGAVHSIDGWICDTGGAQRPCISAKRIPGGHMRTHTCTHLSTHTLTHTHTKTHTKTHTHAHTHTHSLSRTHTLTHTHTHTHTHTPRAHTYSAFLSLLCLKLWSQSDYRIACRGSILVWFLSITMRLCNFADFVWVTKISSMQKSG